MSEAQWREHNKSFQYEPPDDPPELWDDEDYTELADRVIGKGHMGEWMCDKCSKPFRSLRKARHHVERHHMDDLVDRYASCSGGSERNSATDSDLELNGGENT